MSTEAQQLERLRSAMRLLVTLGEPTSSENLANRLCKLAREVLSVDAVALFIDPEVPRPLAADGLTASMLDSMSKMLAGFLPEDFDRLQAWAFAAGFLRVELAPVTFDHHLAGLLAMLTTAAGPTLAPGDLRLLGDGIAASMQSLRAADELRSAFEGRARDYDHRVRNERMRALGAMALGIAHDFNNVLNGILAQVGVSLKLAPPDQALQSALERLRKAALEGGATVEKVQEFSRQRKDQEFSEVPFSQLVDDLAGELQSRTPQLQVRRDVAPELSVHGSHGELCDALQAIVENAVEALHGNGTAPRIITIELATDEEDLVLSITDTGRGMSLDVRRRAFDPFFTTKGSRTKGLGLSLAFGIVQRHGGRIDLESGPGKGTRVKVRLPRLLTPPPRALDAPLPPAPRRRPEGPVRVLLVEDDPDNREALASLLELSGYLVTAAETGSAGVEAFGGARFDVVLTDLGLPDMNGWQVAGSIKASAPATPVALITGWGFNLDSEEIRRRGVDLLIKKPIDPRRFLTQLQTLVA
jgi:signal transduction histidine kinase